MLVVIRSQGKFLCHLFLAREVLVCSQYKMSFAKLGLVTNTMFANQLKMPVLNAS